MIDWLHRRTSIGLWMFVTVYVWLDVILYLSAPDRLQFGLWRLIPGGGIAIWLAHHFA